MKMPRNSKAQIKSKGAKKMWEKKVDRAYYEGYKSDRGEKWYTLVKLAEGVLAYVDKSAYHTVIFESETDERIGIVMESDVRTSWNRYYTASYCYGWDGKRATKKQYWKTLCTRGDRNTAIQMILNEYKNR